MGKIKIEKPNEVKTTKAKVQIKNKVSKSKPIANVKLILNDELRQFKSNLNLNKNLLPLAIEGLFKLREKTVSKKLFEDDYPILLQVTLIKIPDCAERIIRLPLKKSLLTDTAEVCLIVPDLKKGRRVDSEPTKEHYKNLLLKNNIRNIKEVIPFNSIKVEYDQFELKRRLVGLYDHFLVDGKISGHVTHLLGKVFYNRRKVPTSVQLSGPHIKKSIESALYKTQMHIHSKGNNFITQVGHAKMSIEDIALNVLSVIDGLDEMLPGGGDNIRSVHLKTNSSIAIPIYMTLKNSNKIKTPKVPAKRPKICIPIEGQLSTAEDAYVRVLPDGDVIKLKKNK